MRFNLGPEWSGIQNRFGKNGKVEKFGAEKSGAGLTGIRLKGNLIQSWITRRRSGRLLKTEVREDHLEIILPRWRSSGSRYRFECGPFIIITRHPLRKHCAKSSTQRIDIRNFISPLLVFLCFHASSVFLYIMVANSRKVDRRVGEVVVFGFVLRETK